MVTAQLAFTLPRTWASVPRKSTSTSVSLTRTVTRMCTGSDPIPSSSITSSNR